MDLAKKRRLDALNNRSDNRILVRPAAHHSQIRLPKKGTAADYLIEALSRGADVSELADSTGWSKYTVVVNLYKVAKKTGIGIRRRQATLHLMMPRGFEQAHAVPEVGLQDAVLTIDAAAVAVAA
ncbi:MAG: hypothetical protein AAF636_13955 [Pseudomonadota bacterium]